MRKHHHQVKHTHSNPDQTPIAAHDAIARHDADELEGSADLYDEALADTAQAPDASGIAPDSFDGALAKAGVYTPEAPVEFKSEPFGAACANCEAWGEVNADRKCRNCA